MGERHMNPTIPHPFPSDRFHPVANLFPLMEGEQFDALVDDIRVNGLRQPIVEFEGLILDGRNRFNACLQAEVPPHFVPYDGEDPISFVLSANLHRRHLDESQRAMVAVRLPAMRQGRPVNASNEAFAQPAAAKLLNVSRSTVQRAAIVRDKAAPALVARVDRGEMPVSLAAKLAVNFSEDQQRELADKPEGYLRGEVKRTVRARREQELANATIEASTALGKRLYNVIMADPPWRFEPYSRVTGMVRSADNHYPTMATDNICAIIPPAADNCILFLWRTAPMLLDAVRVMAAWGFEYKTEFVWLKNGAAGTGYWNRNRHEVLMVGVRGSVPAPSPGDQYDSVIAAAASEHSVKPPVFAEIIKGMFPTGTLLEMFARKSRAGWDVWGNEVAMETAQLPTDVSL
jgi:N6-adenosine-specific RNA methylase IME4